MCLLLTSSSGAQTSDSILSDKDPILTSLTIKAMNFGLSDDHYNDRPIIAGKGAFYKPNGQTHDAPIREFF
jgi:hypothetical protein